MTIALHLTEAEHRHVENIDRLSSLGLSGVGELLESLSDPSWAVRRAAVAALAEQGDVAVALLTTWLREERTEEHSIAAAVCALVASTGGSVTAAMIEMLDDPRPAVAADAATILGRRRESEATAALARAVSHADDNVAVAAIEALGELGGNGAIEELVAVVTARNFFRTFPALQVLAKSGDPRSVAPLAGLLDDEVYRDEVARALGRTGSARAIAPLAALLSRDGHAIVRLVAYAFADLITRAEWNGAVAQVEETLHTLVSPYLARFAAALETPDPLERAAIATVLGRIGDASVIAALGRLLDDAASRQVATAAIQQISAAHDEAQLVALGGETALRIAVLPVANTPRAAPKLRAMLGDRDPEVRARVCEALARIADVSAVPALFAALGDANPRVTLAALAAIHSLGVADTGARALAALEHGSPTVRRHALRIIAYMGFAEAFDAVRTAVADVDPRIANLAVTALGAIDDPRAEGLLVEIASGASPTLRASAMRAVVERFGDQAGPILDAGLVDEFAWVRYYACQGIGRIGGPQAIVRLVARLEDPAPHVRLAAIEALTRLEIPTAWEALCAVMRSADTDEQRAALVGIGLHPTADALPYLLDSVTSSDVATRLIALSGLASRSEDAALEMLATAARDRDVEIRDAALSLLGERSDPAAAEVVVDLALSCVLDHPVRLTLSRPGAARIAALAGRLALADDRSASILAAALARMRDDRATATLFEALTFTSPRARRASATMLVAMGVDGARSAVARIANADPDLDVQRVCAALVAG